MESIPQRNAVQEAGEDSAGVFARLGMGLADWSQKWFPDAFVFALVGLIIVFVAGLFAGVGMRNLIKYFGDGFWGLIPFTMQMAMIIIGGFVVATSPPVHKLIKKLAKVPRTPRGAVAFVVFFSMMTSLLSWGLGLIFGGILVREIVRNVRGIDYRAIGAAAFVGNGSVWALGLSSSAALVMATPASIPSALLKISGVIPLSLTIYTWQSAATAAILTISCVTVALSIHSGEFDERRGIVRSHGRARSQDARGAQNAGGVAGVCARAYDCGRDSRPGLHRASSRRERSSRRAGFEYLQSFVPDDGAFAALAAAVFRARGERFGSGDGGRPDSISFLWRNLRDHHVFHAGREAGAFFCELFLDEFVSDPGLDLLGSAGDVRALRRQQMDY